MCLQVDRAREFLDVFGVEGKDFLSFLVTGVDGLLDILWVWTELWERVLVLFGVPINGDGLSDIFGEVVAGGGGALYLGILGVDGKLVILSLLARIALRNGIREM